MTGTNPDNEETVRRLCAAFARRDLDELCAFFTPDAVYHNIPVAPAEGIEAIRAALELFVPESPYLIFEIINIASDGSVVFTERVDRMEILGKTVEQQVNSVFELEGGRVKAWRNYFDLQSVLSFPG
jgi:limonene-1,2-epoxide hydrolase